MTQVTLLFIFFLWLPLLIVLFYLHVSSDPAIFLNQYQKCENRMQRRLYDTLRNNGYYVRVKEKCGPYTLDLVLPYYRIALRCVCETDKIEDFKKRKYLDKQGWRVIPVKEKDLNGKITTILAKIETAAVEYKK
ncbi:MULTISPECIES: hypothetical protein [Metabacillus]|uniref:Uncharacterized protein n=1 Tax=Metabacillus hrfriensis TaxID=3048891 RepID=A0ACD4RFH3_9BACI|nr:MULTISPECIES: hypothetical protein [Metabacillus]UAL53702.1 hypothetical protein K8L98_07980 [Metabacillus dongyingensis]USK30013.1 hypothetical protein LIT32_07890 [Bacillus sp. CMF21]WHZ59256.1 hypothetical protein QLQ22_08000 [Metabacillus sp. CT-WN-B3]